MRVIGSVRWQRYLVAAFSWVLVVGCGSSGGSSAEEAPVGIEVGNRPPPLDGRLASGEPFVLSGEAGGPHVVVFYRSATCGLCRVQIEQLQTNLPAYERQGAQVVAVTLDPPETSLALASEMNVTFPLVSVDSAVFDEWGVMDRELGGPMPATYILDRSGIIHFRHIGRTAADRTSDAGMVSILAEVSGQ